MESIPGWSIGTLSNIQDRPHEPFLPSSAALTAVGPRWRTAARGADEMQLPDEPPFTANHWRAASRVAPFCEASLNTLLGGVNQGTLLRSPYAPASAGRRMCQSVTP